MKHHCLYKNDMKSDVVEAAESVVAIQFKKKYNVHTINIAVHRQTCTNNSLWIMLSMMLYQKLLKWQLFEICRTPDMTLDLVVPLSKIFF